MIADFKWELPIDVNRCNPRRTSSHTAWIGLGEKAGLISPGDLRALARSPTEIQPSLSWRSVQPTAKIGQGWPSRVILPPPTMRTRTRAIRLDPSGSRTYQKPWIREIKGGPPHRRQSPPTRTLHRTIRPDATLAYAVNVRPFFFGPKICSALLIALTCWINIQQPPGPKLRFGESNACRRFSCRRRHPPR